MGKRRKWLLWADVIVLALLVAFVCDMWVGAMPPLPYRDVWEFQWPPFVGADFVRIPDWVRSASVLGVLITALVPLAYGLRAIGTGLRVVLTAKRKALR